jgi:hypothetical protein
LYWNCGIVFCISKISWRRTHLSLLIQERVFFMPRHEMAKDIYIVVLPTFHHPSVVIGFRSLSLERLHTFNSNLVYGCIIGLCRSGSNLVMVRWIFYRVIPLKEIFSFCSLTFVWIYMYV